MHDIVNIIVLAVCIVATLYMLKKGINLGLIMLMDSVFVAILARIPIDNALKFGFFGAFSEKTLMLILVLFLIMLLENIMRTSDMIKNMVESLKEIVGSNRLAAGLLPAVIGILPSPGGARFSCPMVEGVVGGNSADGNKAFINYWFRHIWIDGFILYPGAIVAAEIIGVSVIDFFIHLLPFIGATIVIGAIFGLTRVKKESIVRKKSLKDNLQTLMISLSPIIGLIFIYILLLDYTGYALQIASALVVMVMFIIKKYSFKRILKASKDAFPAKLVLIIIGVMVFKEILLKSGVMDSLPELMASYNIPVEILFLLLPFLGGVSSGITVSFVSLTFPILIPLGLGDNLWYATVAFVAGFIGNMITPLHLCAVVSTDYFKSALGKLLTKVAAAEVTMAIVVTVVLFAIVH